MNKELQILSQLEDYKNLDDSEKMMLKIDLEEMKIPAGQIDLESEKVLDAVKRVLLGDFNGKQDGEAVGDVMNAYREPKIRMLGGLQIELNIGEDTLILSNHQYKALVDLLALLPLDELRELINGDRWRTVENLTK